MLPPGNNNESARVAKRVKNDDGNPVGIHHNNPILDGREYEVEFPDWSTETYTANVIAENVYAQINAEGHQHVILKEIVGHNTDASALTPDDGFTVNANGACRPKFTTRGWKLNIIWWDGSTSWVPLKDLKKSNPVELE
jgi:hypothetical protein